LTNFFLLRATTTALEEATKKGVKERGSAKETPSLEAKGVSRE